MKLIVIIMICLICFIMITEPKLSDAEVGDKLVGSDSIIFTTFNSIGSLSKFFSTASETIKNAATSVGDWFNTAWTDIKDFFGGLFK